VTQFTTAQHPADANVTFITLSTGCDTRFRETQDSFVKPSVRPDIAPRAVARATIAVGKVYMTAALA
jgi:hypothetical protein